MEIKTKYLDLIEIDKDKIISFPNGILGFEDHKEFVILDIQDNSHFKFLQDIHKEHIAFLLINPWDFYEDYDIEVSDERLKKIKIISEDAGGIEVYNIVTMGQSLQNSTTNLLAPIVINTKDKIGKQIILENSPYRTKHKLLQEGDKSC